MHTRLMRLERAAEMPISMFDANALQAICGVLGDTSTGLTGSEIGRLLDQAGIEDCGISTKRHRLYDALSRRQQRDRSGNNIGAFVQHVMAPVRWVGRQTAWEGMRAELNEVLAFSGLQVDGTGILVSAAQTRTFAPQPPTEDQEPPEPPATDHAARDRTLALGQMVEQFQESVSQADRQGAGRSLEALLTRLFDLFGLEPHGSIRVIGEQIDGSFDLDREVYLLEAKWTTDLVGEAELLVLRGKVEGKAQFTRGLFISITGYSREAIEAVTRGKTPNFVMIDGGHLYRVLAGDWPLDRLLRHLVRALAETGAPYVPVSDLADIRF
jgi:hypothetical protein